ncbi:MAG TPA: EH signature domain-containing protein [Leptolyngbyaceae cyanobacterium]
MNFQFRQMQLPPSPSQWEPTKLKRASERIIDKLVINLNIRKIKTNSPRSVDEIITDIQNGQDDCITQLEWVYCLYAKTEWDRKHPDLAKQTSQLIWQVATHDSWLKYRLFWHLALHYSKFNTVAIKYKQLSLIPSSLVETFPEFAIRVTGNDGLPVQLIRTLSQKDAAQNLAKISWQYLRTPQELLETANLPSAISQATIALDCIAGIFAKNQLSNRQEVEWLLRCLQQMSSQQQIASVEELLDKVSSQIVTRLSKIVEWLQQQYSPIHHESKWHQFSDSAKANLSQWIGTINYGYFQTLIDLLIRMLELPDEERQQLEERRDFWANYSDRIQRIRLILPQSSLDSLGYQLQIAVDTLAENNKETTEICIFDLGNYFVVEFLRGAGKEARLLPRQPNIELMLFGPSQLSAKRLRQLGGEICDRVCYWQPNCEKLLREKKIYPNSAIDYFFGLPKHQGKYDSNNGLSLPSPKEQKERDAKLKQWHREMEKLEK